MRPPVPVTAVVAANRVPPLSPTQEDAWIEIFTKQEDEMTSSAEAAAIGQDTVRGQDTEVYSPMIRRLRKYLGIGGASRPDESPFPPKGAAKTFNYTMWNDIRHTLNCNRNTLQSRSDSFACVIDQLILHRLISGHAWNRNELVEDLSLLTFLIAYNHINAYCKNHIVPKHTMFAIVLDTFGFERIAVAILTRDSGNDIVL